MRSHSKFARTSLVAAAVAAALAAGTASAATISIVQGTVGGASFTPPTFADTAAASSAATTVAATYSGATVFFDLNGNGKLDAGEPSTTTAADGSFKLSSTKGVADIVALIPATTQSLVTSSNATSTSRNVFRASAAQVQAATVSPLIAAKVDVTPLTTEVARAAQFDGLTFAQARDNLASRIDVSSNDVLLAPTKVLDSTELPAILKEAVIDTDRDQLAAKFVDRGDTVGALRGNFDLPTSANYPASDLLPVSDIWTAQNYAQNLEGMPRYDYVFLIIEENESLSSLKNNSSLPFLNSFLNNGSQFYSYYSTGNPSEPNYLALGSADDWGQTGDEAIPYPAITGNRANVSSSVDAHGLSWRHYEGSLYPSPAGTTANVGASSWKTGTGGAFFDNPSVSTIVGSDGNTYSGGLVAKKHNTVSWFADVVAQSNFLSRERSIASTDGKDANGHPIGYDVNGNPITYSYPSNTANGANNWTSAGNWDLALQAYANSNNITGWWNGKPWNQDQFLEDLKTGDVANYNVIVPDQQDDMHNPGTVPRADFWAENIVRKIESSSIWNDPTKRVAIVVTFDEGESVSTACCGWNPMRSGNGKASPVLVNVGSNGAVSYANGGNVTGVAAHDGSSFSSTYSNGNHGHGVTLFGVYSNQQAAGKAPTGHYDTDYYSHFSYVRTLQDILGLADPGRPETYVNRSKFTESFIAQNAALLPELLNSSNTHFDGVRAMNHVYQFPAGATRQGTGTSNGVPNLPITSGPDLDSSGNPDNTNLWAVK